MTRAPADKRPHDAKIIGALSEVATKLGGQLKSGASMKGTVLVFDGTLEVEITMVVRPKPTRDAREAHIFEALRMLVLEPYRDRCNESVKSRRGSWGTSHSCSKSPTYVSVTKSSRLFGGEPEHYYTLLCTAHAKVERGGVAIIEIPKERLNTARFEIKTRAELKLKLEGMTPEERVVEDAIAAGRPKHEIAMLRLLVPPLGTVDQYGVFLCRCGASHRRGPLSGFAVPGGDGSRYRCLKCGSSGRVTLAEPEPPPSTPSTQATPAASLRFGDGPDDEPNPGYRKIDPRIFE